MVPLLKKDFQLIDVDKPEVAADNIIDAISRFGDRAELLRELETEDASAQKAFDEAKRADWDAVNTLRQTYEAQAPHDRNIAQLDSVIERRAAIADMKRATHNAVLAMVGHLVETVVSSTGQPEDWVRRALEFATFPAQREAQHAIDVHFELEALASEVDPDNGLSGDVLETGDDVDAWFARMLSEQR